MKSYGKKRRNAFNKLLSRVIGVLNYFSVDYTITFSQFTGQSAYLEMFGVLIRVSDHGDMKKRQFIFNFRTYKPENELSKELLLFRKFIIKTKKHVVNY